MSGSINIERISISVTVVALVLSTGTLHVTARGSSRSPESPVVDHNCPRRFVKPATRHHARPFTLIFVLGLLLFFRLPLFSILSLFNALIYRSSASSYDLSLTAIPLLLLFDCILFFVFQAFSSISFTEP